MRPVTRQGQQPALSEVVVAGLAKPLKALPSWLLYDAHGDRLFQRIMELPEYYPTRCETEILHRYKESLHYYFTSGSKTSFQLIEPGAGDGKKTEILLKHLSAENVRFDYIPIDISGSVLDHLASRLKQRLPGISVKPVATNYLEFLPEFTSAERKVVLFLGASIGNYDTQQAIRVLKTFAAAMNTGDLLLLGIDLKKDPRTVLAAYDDSRGVTREFNLNVLRRINRELGADFDLSGFTYFPTYNPDDGEVTSYLVSCKAQKVFIPAVNQHFEFRKWEPMLTEISRKYSLDSIQMLLENSGFEWVECFLDEKEYFADVLARRRVT